MIIIIDGYNFLKSITGTTFINDRVMSDWMGKFQQYMHYRGNRIIMVFDAGPSYYPSSEWYGAVEVLYAGQDQIADDLLKKWLLKHRGLEVLLVSSDREIRDWAENLQLASISSQDFNRVFVDVMKREERQLSSFQQTMYKTKEDDCQDDFLDALMEMGSRDLVSGIIKNEYAENIRVRDGKKASKTDKAAMKKIHKI